MNKKYDILIIDDEEVIINAIKMIATFNELTTATAINPKDALALLEEAEFNLIITDIMMPEMDGFQFLEIVKQMKIKTPVIMTTGYSTLENAIRALNCGAIAFVPKPFSFEELTSVFKRGMEYSKITNKLNSRNDCDDLLSIIPCPPKYYRLGFDSWMNEEYTGTVKIGVTDLFLNSVGTLDSIDIMNVDENIYQGNTSLKIIDSNEYIHQVLSPISGKIVSVNEKLLENINLLAKDPYFEGWIYTIIPFSIEVEIKNLTSCSSDI
ncbi:MAG: response regulator [Bacteroidetes bacterium]|nr:response regulator [Bacteroidota bacterium]MBU1116456.1 response regulator [Bacteroidota bacterium]MBU1800036.1 response regulator [Bacteroidota bacterium]